MTQPTPPQPFKSTKPNAARTQNVPAAASPQRCITIDVEEYFHIEAARTTISPNDWPTLPSRVESQISLLLQLFDTHQVKATFFVLGYVAYHHPKLIKTLHSLGHEVACHGFFHNRIHHLTPHELYEDLHKAKSTIENIISAPVLGYRAPTWSITPKTAHAIDILKSLHFTYDASIFPTTHPQYGIPTAPTSPYILQSPPTPKNTDFAAPNKQKIHDLSSTSNDQKTLKNKHKNAKNTTNRLLEIPPLVLKTPYKNLPAAGGGYFRQFPLFVMKSALKQAAKQNRPAILYFHPWEFDPNIPKLPLSFLSRVRTYRGLKSSTRKLNHILTHFKGFTTIRSLIDSLDQDSLQTYAPTE